jgi:hypothetical protein
MCAHALCASVTLSGDDVKFITALDVERTLREIASKVYKLDPNKDKLISSVSLVIPAVVHSLGFTEIQIQFLLRWRSNAFMTYLRNLAIIAEKQTQALDAAGAMPHFLKLILYSFGSTDTQMKFLLGWRSNACIPYLRNLAVLAEKQMQALDAAGAM